LNLTQINSHALGGGDAVHDISNDVSFTGGMRPTGNLNQSMFYAPSNNPMILEDLDGDQDGFRDNEIINMKSPVNLGKIKIKK
jgi:hypothetical protein